MQRGSTELSKYETVRNNRLASIKRVSLDLRSSINHENDYKNRISSVSEHTNLKPGKKAVDVVADDSNLLSIEEFLKITSSKNSSRNSTTSSLKSFTDMPNFILENLNDEKQVLKHASHKIGIEIINLVMCEDSSLLTDDSANFLFVEYSFLNYKGHLLETQSLPKPKKSGECTYYHFYRSFEVRPSENRRQFKMLKIMLEKNSKHNLKFLIVSEPITIDQEDSGDCEEVGFGFAKLNKLVQEATEDVITTKIECFSTDYPHELIAFLNIKISGALIMKKLRNLK